MLGEVFKNQEIRQPSSSPSELVSIKEEFAALSA
jgi:hypothetical protein